MKKPINETCWAEAPAKIWNIINDMQDNQTGAINLENLPAAIQRAVENDIEWTYFDFETIWPDYCSKEIADPFGSMVKAKRLARAAGLKIMQANYWEDVPRPGTPQTGKVTWKKWWAAHARTGDAVDIQLPGYPQNDVQTFGALTKSAVDIIKKANPNIEWILINMIEYMSDDKAGLERAWQAAKPHVQGRWVWK